MIRNNPLRFLLPLAALLCLSGCETAAGLLLEPEPTDPNDGYEGYGQSGVNTEMDWGPKQNKLLAEYETLLQKFNALDKEKRTLLSQKQNLEAQLASQNEDYEREKGLRAQIEAQLDLARQKIDEHYATILSLRIAKARAEQEALLSKIELAEATMKEMSSTLGSTEAAAVPPANR